MSEPTEAEVRARHDSDAYGVCRHDWRWPCDTARVLGWLDAERDSQAARDRRALAALREAARPGMFIRMNIYVPHSPETINGVFVEVGDGFGRQVASGSDDSIEAAALAALAALPKEGRG